MEGNPHNISRSWIVILFLLCITATCVAVIVKGFHVFSDTRNEPFIQGADDAHYFLWLRSWVVDGDLDFANDIQNTPYLEDSAKQFIATLPLTENGLTQNKFTVGWAVMTLPGYLIAHGITHVIGWEQDGYSAPYQVAIWVQQMLIALLGFFISWKILQRWFSSKLSIIAIMATWLISPLIYYQTARIAMVHNVIYTLAVLIVWLALLIKDHIHSSDMQKRTLTLLVFASAFQAGLMLICRPTTALYLILPLSIIIHAMMNKWKSYPWFFSGLLFLAVFGAFLGVFPQLFAWKTVYGHWIYYSYQGEGFNWGSPQILVSLFGDHHGLFNWHPLLLIGLLSLLIASVKGKFYKSWILTLSFIIWTNSAWHMVYFGSAFGGRAYEFVVFFAMIGMAFLLQWFQSRTFKTNLLLACFTGYACWNIVFMYLFMQGLISREEPVSWVERLMATTEIFVR